MKKIFLMALVALVMSACDSEPKFEVKGHVMDAGGKMLYLEAVALNEIFPVDSVELEGNGKFSMKGNRPIMPEFFRLRVDNKVINFSIDSTEVVTFETAYVNFATNYTVEGSENSAKIKELTQKQTELQNKVNRLMADMQTFRIAAGDYQDQLSALLKEYKNDVKVNYIFAAPNSPVAYFALFQKLNNYMIFDPLNSKDDVKCFAAVATSMYNAYPHTDRARNIYDIAIKGMKNTRTPKQQVVEFPEEKISEAGVIDVALRDIKGNMRKLSELKGKVVILDFTIYQTAVSSSHNYLLRDLYDKYKSRGLEIYQVSLDADEHYWKTIADNLPWVCVRDAAGVYSEVAATYNVQDVPTLFLVKRNGDLSARDEGIEDLEKAVKALL